MARDVALSSLPGTVTTLIGHEEVYDQLRDEQDIHDGIDCIPEGHLLTWWNERELERYVYSGINQNDLDNR